MRTVTNGIENMAPGQIWVGHDTVVFPLRWEGTEGERWLVLEVCRSGDVCKGITEDCTANFLTEEWESPEDLFCVFPGFRRLI